MSLKDATESSGASRNKRKWDAWSEQEVETFFECINMYGVREFSKTSQYLGTKTREQVRHYYYRLLKKINLCLLPYKVTVNKQDREEVRRALSCWYNFKKREGSLTSGPSKDTNSVKNLAALLHKAITSSSGEESNNSDSSPSSVAESPSPPYVAVQSIVNNQQYDHPSTHNHVQGTYPSHHTLIENVKQEPQNLQNPALDDQVLPMNAPLRLTLQLLPKERQISEMLIKHGYNPFVQLNFSHKKPVSKIVEYVLTRWVLPPFNIPIAPAPIRFYPPQEPAHSGWGLESDITAGELYDLLGRPQVMQVWYSWLPQLKPTNLTSNGGIIYGEETEDNSWEDVEETFSRRGSNSNNSETPASLVPIVESRPSISGMDNTNRTMIPTSSNSDINFNTGFPGASQGKPSQAVVQYMHNLWNQTCMSNKKRPYSEAFTENNKEYPSNQVKIESGEPVYQQAIVPYCNSTGGNNGNVSMNNSSNNVEIARAEKRQKCIDILNNAGRSDSSAWRVESIDFENLFSQDPNNNGGNPISYDNNTSGTPINQSHGGNLSASNGSDLRFSLSSFLAPVDLV